MHYNALLNYLKDYIFMINQDIFILHILKKKAYMLAPL